MNDPKYHGTRRLKVACLTKKQLGYARYGVTVSKEDRSVPWHNRLMSLLVLGVSGKSPVVGGA